MNSSLLDNRSRLSQGGGGCATPPKPESIRGREYQDPRIPPRFGGRGPPGFSIVNERVRVVGSRPFTRSCPLPRAEQHRPPPGVAPCDAPLPCKATSHGATA